MRALDVVTSLVMLTLCGVVWFATRDLPVWTDFSPGPAFAPVGIAAVGALLSVALLVDALRRGRDEPADWPERAGALKVAMIVAALWAVVLLAEVLGLVPAAAAMCLFLLVAVERRPLGPSLIATAITIGLVYGVFVAWLGVALPTGVLGV